MGPLRPVLHAITVTASALSGLPAHTRAEISTTRHPSEERLEYHDLFFYVTCTTCTTLTHERFVCNGISHSVEHLGHEECRALRSRKIERTLAIARCAAWGSLSFACACNLRCAIP